MNSRIFQAVALCLLASEVGSATAADTVPLKEVTGPWLGLLRSDNPTLRAAAVTALADIVRKHPGAANDLVRGMAAEQNGGVVTEYVDRLVPLAKEMPVVVSSLIRVIRERETAYPARNFCVKVLSLVGPAAATPEFIEALTETYCPVPGAYLRIMRALGKDAIPILTTGFRHPNANVRKWVTIALRVMGRTDPVILNLFNGLQAEPPLLQKLREGAPADRLAAVAALAELARTVPGTATALITAVKNEADGTVLAEVESRVVALGRGSPEVVAVLVAAIRNEDEYRLRRLGMRVLPKLGAALNTKEMIEAMGDHSCPVPGAVRRILLTAGPDALPILHTAMKHSNPEIRATAASILQRIPAPVVQNAPTPQP